jgi:hypothetical protein
MAEIMSFLRINSETLDEVTWIAHVVPGSECGDTDGTGSIVVEDDGVRTRITFEVLDD